MVGENARRCNDSVRPFRQLLAPSRGGFRSILNRVQEHRRPRPRRSRRRLKKSPSTCDAEVRSHRRNGPFVATTANSQARVVSLDQKGRTTPTSPSRRGM